MSLKSKSLPTPALQEGFWLQHTERGKETLPKPSGQLSFRLNFRNTHLYEFILANLIPTCDVAFDFSSLIPMLGYTLGTISKQGQIFAEFQIAPPWQFSLHRPSNSFLASYAAGPRTPFSRAAFSLLISALYSKLPLSVQAQKKEVSPIFTRMWVSG